MQSVRIRSLYFPDGCLTDQERAEIPSKSDFYKRAWKIAWPAVAEALFTGLAGLVDTGHGLDHGDAAVAAVGLCSQPKFVCLCLVTSLNVGMTAILSGAVWEKTTPIGPAAYSASRFSFPFCWRR